VDDIKGKETLKNEITNGNNGMYMKARKYKPKREKNTDICIEEQI
jgi:hypothetical protein